MQERGHLEDTGIGGRVLKWIIKKYNWRTDWIHLIQDRRAVLTMVIHLCVL
jgi:hypothetical protein